MIKRCCQLLFCINVLLIVSPFIFFSLLVTFLIDFENPIYVSERVGLHGKPFKMYKIRSMRIDKRYTNIVSTQNNDPRLTIFGKLLRYFKIDEFLQFINVIKGDMNIVGPRPNIRQEVRMYTTEELKILGIKPGITDIASIVFSDLNQILAGHDDPNLSYNQLVRPWKSRLCLFYVERNNIQLDLALIFYTITNLFARNWTLKKVNKLLIKFKSDNELASESLRNTDLVPYPPPGRNTLITSEEYYKDIQSM